VSMLTKGPIFMSEFSKLLKGLFESRRYDDPNFTVEYVAEVAGVSDRQIRRILAGEQLPSLITMERIAIALTSDLKRYARTGKTHEAVLFDLVNAAMMDARIKDIQRRRVTAMGEISTDPPSDD
jgi:transcriptional regulator with XRE-family HTH domain